MPGFGFGFGLSLLAMLAAGGTPPAPTPGTTLATLPSTPAVRYHPHSQSNSVTKAGNQVTACPDLQGLAAMSGVDGSTTVGPYEWTDPLGRKCWRFNGTLDGNVSATTAQYAFISSTLAMASNRGFAVFLVGRVPHGRNTIHMLNPRYTSDGTTAANSSIGYLRGTVTSNSAPFLQGGNPAASTNATDCYKVIPGAQMQVIGIASRTTANGGTRLYINNDKCDVAQQTTAVSGYLGGIIGGTPGTITLSGNVANVFDLYELIIYTGELSNAQADAIAAALVSHYQIAQLDRQLVIEGDSILDGIPSALGVSPAWHGGMGSALTEPGSTIIPANVRVVSLARSGNQISDALTRRDATNSIWTQRYPGGTDYNQVAAQFGRNDMSQTGGQKNSATFYADVVSLINTAGTGYLQRGWKVNWVANIAGNSATVTTNVSPAGENTMQKRLEGFRAKIADQVTHAPLPQFLTDTMSGGGQTYAGLVNVIHAYAISQGGNAWFYDAVVAGDYYPAGPYDSDATHLVGSGVALLASGGDTPQYGIGSVM